MFLQLLGNNCEMRSERERERGGGREGERKNYCRVSVTLRSLAAPLIIIKETVRHVSNDWLGGNEDGVGEGVRGQPEQWPAAVSTLLSRAVRSPHTCSLVNRRALAGGRANCWHWQSVRFTRTSARVVVYIFVTKSCTACYARCCLPVKWWVIYHQSPGSRIPTDNQG